MVDWSPAKGGCGFFGGFGVGMRRRGRGGELPFYEGEVLMDGVEQGRTGIKKSCGQAWCAECGLCRGGEIERRRYMAVKTTFGLGLESN